jgi:Holliday junction DNA helicase RuvA
MIAQLRGVISHAGEGVVIIDVGGIGYEVSVPSPAIRELSIVKENVTLHTHLAVREDALTLYGFLHSSELAMFRLLIGVNRVGPQLALNIISVLSVDELAAAILHEDEMVLTRCPGIGPKNAKRLILELKDRMKKVNAGAGPRGERSSQPVDDAVSALISLGFTPGESRSAVQAAAAEHAEADVQALIKTALVRMKGL